MKKLYRNKNLFTLTSFLSFFGLLFVATGSDGGGLSFEAILLSAFVLGIILIFSSYGVRYCKFKISCAIKHSKRKSILLSQKCEQSQIKEKRMPYNVGNYVA